MIRSTIALLALATTLGAAEMVRPPSVPLVACDPRKRAVLHVPQQRRPDVTPVLAAVDRGTAPPRKRLDRCCCAHRTAPPAVWVPTTGPAPCMNGLHYKLRARPITSTQLML